MNEPLQDLKYRNGGMAITMDDEPHDSKDWLKFDNLMSHLCSFLCGFFFCIALFFGWLFWPFIERWMK